MHIFLHTKPYFLKQIVFITTVIDQISKTCCCVVFQGVNWSKNFPRLFIIRNENTQCLKSNKKKGVLIYIIIDSSII